MDIPTLNRCEQVAVNLAKEAGYMMLSASGKCKNPEIKANPCDLVTETDKAVEKYVFNELRRIFPDHKFIGEETASEKINWTVDPTWIIDPIDGTMNFVHTFPFACISIGLTVNKDIVLGLIYCPFLDRMFLAKKGFGAYCNGQPIHVSNCKSLMSSLLITELGGTRTEEFKTAVQCNINNLMWKVRGLRALGSAAMNACMIAMGAVDCYFENGLHCWDMVAGVLIIQEAGGVVLNPEGGPFDLMGRRILAAGTEALAKELVAEITHNLHLQRD